MNLADVVPTIDAPTLSLEASQMRQALTAKADEAVNAKALIEKLMQKPIASSVERDGLTAMRQRLDKELMEHKAAMVTTSGTLDRTFYDDSVLTKAAKTPKINLRDARAIANKLGFPIFPFEYLNPQSFDSERFEIRESISSFRALSTWFDLYVIGPISHYSVKKHVEAPEDKVIFAPESVAQAFMALSMAIPMFRAMSVEMKQMKQELHQAVESLRKYMESRFEKTEQELRNLTKRMDALEDEVGRQKRERAIQQAQEQRRAEEMRQRIAALEAQRWRGFDPMLLAVPKGADILGDGWALMGPCWGPDSEDIVFEALGLAKLEGHREAIEKPGLWRPPLPPVVVEAPKAGRVLKHPVDGHEVLHFPPDDDPGAKVRWGQDDEDDPPAKGKKRMKASDDDTEAAIMRARSRQGKDDLSVHRRRPVPRGEQGAHLDKSRLLDNGVRDPDYYIPQRNYGKF